jgi:hypothetical protein
LILALISGWSGRGQTFSEDFSTYPPGSDAGPAWEPNTAFWSVVEGGYQGEQGASLLTTAPWARSIRFACDVTVLEPLPGDWLTAGIGLQVDERNYWALNLVMAPEGHQRRHSTEMQEMLHGVWLAPAQPATRLEPLPSRGANFNWQVGKTYRLEVDLCASNIVGHIREGTRELSAFGYRLDAPGTVVRVGRPMLRANGLRARFSNIAVTFRETAPAPARETRQVAPWVARPGKALTKGSGFFRTLEAGGRWWLVDPEGKPFFDIGTDHVSYGGHWCETLGYAPYHRNVAAKYGNEAAWGEATLQRLKGWGFNCLPAGHSPSLRHQGLAHIEFASFGSAFARHEWIARPVNWTGFPDVFSPRWERHCRILARNIAQQSRGDPWCIGTFLDNELEWYGKNGHLVDEVFQLGAAQAAKLALGQWLLQHFGSLAELNRQLGTSHATDAAFLSTTNVPAPGPALDRVREGFMAEIAERYFSVASRALRESDPDHLVLGCRFAGQVPKAALAAAGRYNDVFTLNTYPRVDFENAWLPDGTGGTVESVPQQVSEYYAIARKPMIITEWSFPALDSGLPCKYGAGMRVDTQEQKAACYRIFANTIAGLPFMVGYHYFMWADEPAQGISRAFPEDSNYGLVNEKDEPYLVFTQTVAEVNGQAAQRHGRSHFSGHLALAARSGEVEVRNPDALAAYGPLRLTVRGSNRVEEVRLQPGERRRFDMPSDTPWCAELQNWDGSKKRVLGGGSVTDASVLVNVSSQHLARVPVLVEKSDAVLALGFTEHLAPGESVRLDTLTLKLEPCNQIELGGSNTTWVCSGQSGALFDRIESGGLGLGRLVFAVHQQLKGRDHWVESSRILRLETQTAPQAWVIEAEVEYPGAPDGPAGYRARVRAVVFKELGLAMVRPLWVESRDARSWQLVEVYWFCRSAIGGSPENDVVGGPAVPNYYRAAQFITDSQLEGCFGSLNQQDGWQVMFWTNPQGGIHPDSRLAVDREMSPNDRWQPAAMPYLWVYAASQTDAWKGFSKSDQQAKQVMRFLPAHQNK